MIHLIDNRTDEVAGFISEDQLIEATHIQDADSKAETLDFMIVMEDENKGLTERNRAVFEDDDGTFREVIIENIEDTNDERMVYSNASYLEDLNNARPIAPGGQNQYTTKQWVEFALADTIWEMGIVEYDGFRSISWTSYNTPYEILNIVANRFDMSLRFRVEVEHNRVVGRYVDLVKINHLFNGKEIVRGKDLDVFKRTINTENMATALICLGPEPADENDERLVAIVKDDKANAKYNKPGQYIWRVYEPQSEDRDMTLARLRSLGRTELNKRKQPTIDYEITAVNLGHLYGHEKVRLYDKVRIKDEELNRYAEANTKRITRNLLDETDRVFVFGDIVEYSRSDIRQEFNSIISALRERLKNAESNTDQIRQDLEDNAFEYERKIEKSDTPPSSPKIDDFWLDTSHEKVSILKRWNGTEWLKASASEASDIGAITREEALYETLTNTFESLTVRHSELQNEVDRVLSSEYMVDTTLIDTISTKLNTVNNTFQNIEANLDAMTIDTATIGALIDIQSLIVDYRNAVQTLSVSLKDGRKSMDERLALLQSQYSDAKFSEALDEVGNTFGLQIVDGKIIGDPMTDGIFKTFVEDTNEGLSQSVKYVDYTTDEDGNVVNLNQEYAEQDILKDAVNLRAQRTELNKTAETLSQVISELLIDTTNGLVYTYNENGTMTGYSVGPDGIQFNTPLFTINDGDVEIENGVTRIKEAVIEGAMIKEAQIGNAHIKNLSLDKLMGGEATFGGSGSNGSFKVLDEDDNPLMRVDEHQVAASEFSIGTARIENLENDEVVKRLEENVTFHVRGSTGSDMNDGSSWSNGSATAQRFIDSLPKFINSDVRIRFHVDYDMEELIVVSGFTGSGSITFDYEVIGATPQPVSYLIQSCTIPIYFEGGGTRPTIESVGESKIIEVVNSVFVEVLNLKLNGDGATNYGLLARNGSVVSARNVVVNNVKNCMMAQHARLSVNVCSGRGSEYGLWASRGGIITGEGSAPAGDVSNILAHQGGFTQGNWTFPLEQKPPKATAPKQKVATFHANSATHYYNNSVGWNTTHMASYPLQGNWSGYPVRKDGLWFFGSKLDVLNGKTIKRIRVRVGRTATGAQGYTGSRKFTLRMHQHENRPSGAPTFTSGTYTGYLEMGERKWFDVTNAFANYITSSSWKGFGVMTTSTSDYEYMAMMKSMTVEVTYEV